MPSVTIAIPTYQRGPLLRRALESALGQTYRGELEILVVENPSDQTPGVGPTYAESICLDLADPRIRHFRNSSNLGMAGNWNKCIELAASPWVVLLHDDDWLAPAHIELSLALARSHPQLKLIGSQGYIERADADPHPDPPPDHPIRAIRLTPRHYLLGNTMFASGVMVDRETALSLGGFDPTWFPTMDHLLWLRFAEAAPCARIQQPLMHYFIGDNVSLDPATLISSITNDYRQRNELISRRFFGLFMLRVYSQIKPYRERVFLESRFRTRIPAARLEQSLSAAGWRATPRLFRWIYFPIRLILEGVSLLMTRRLSSTSTPPCPQSCD